MKEQIRTHVGMAQTHPHQGGGPLSLISCVSGREASPLDDDSGGPVEMKTETKKKRFHPLRNLRRMFRRKSRRSSVSNESYKPETGDGGGLQPATNLDQRSRSTGRLLEDETSQNRSRKDGLAPGLSLSHDSVFAADRADSGHSSSDLENSSLSIPISVPGVRFRAELADAVRRRNRESDEDEEEDLGLPRSPCSSPTTAEALGGEKSRELVVKSQSSCSEGSLPSMESSDAELEPPDSKSDFDLSVESQKLSHSAAKHKMAVRPRRNHGAPRGKRTRKSGTALPATPEANEETAVENRFSAEVSPSVRDESPAVRTSLEDKVRMVDPRKKSASLPHGAALSSSPKVTRSRSNVVAGISGAAPLRKRNSSEAEDDPAEEQTKTDDENRGKKDESFFGRLLPRRSGKKKKSDPESERDAESSKEDLSEDDKSGTLFSKKIPKTHPKNPERRQRIEPLDVSAGFPSEDFTRNRMKISYSVSPPRNPWPARAVSRSISPPETVWPERCFPLSDEADGDESKNARKNAYESSWEENVRKIGGRISPAGRFLKNESSSAKRTRREISPVKARRESSPSRLHSEPTPAMREKPPIQKSQSFRNFSADSDFSAKPSATPKEDPKRIRTSAPLPFPRKSASLESVGSVRIESVTGKASSSENFPFPGAGFVITHEEPEYANLEKVLPVLDSFEKVHHGYENIQIIELVRKEAKTKNLAEGTEPEVKKPAKPPVFEKPNAVPEFMRVQLNKVESRNSLPEKTETVAPEVEARNRPKSTLIERRKSELLSTAESEEKNFKPKVVSVQKQVPVKKPEPEPVPVPVPVPPKPKPVLNQKSTENEKTEAESEVVLRKKPTAAHKEDQPELMKVFARRSLKIKEDEVSSDDSRKSRDSDKENEIAESPKEERKIRRPEPEPEIPAKPEILRKSKTVERLVVDVTPLKPAAVARNSVFRKYGRACSESAIEKPPEPASPPPEKKSPEPETAEESGFKRIQQRKLEWEKRMQAAKQ